MLADAAHQALKCQEVVCSLLRQKVVENVQCINGACNGLSESAERPSGRLLRAQFLAVDAGEVQVTRHLVLEAE